MEGPPDIRVLIVGAGIGGLLLAILFEKAAIPYVVIERATSFRPLGSAIAIAAAVQPLLEQLGLLDDLNESSRPEQSACFYDGHLNRLGTVDATFSKDRYGYYTRLLSRPTLYSILLKRIPKEKIMLGKRVIRVDQTEAKATVRCADNSTFEADIVVGADGAYSAVRQNIYRDLEKKQKLPSSDAKPMAIDQECVVGTSEPLDPAEFPLIEGKFSNLQIVLSVDRQYAFWALPVEDNRICWSVSHMLESKKHCKHEPLKTSEWGPAAAEELCAKVRGIDCPLAGRIDDIMDNTKPELRSRVNLEEKLFKTWSSGRVVLIGDACHKVVPHAGQGAVQAIFDAVAVANQLSELQHNTLGAITQCFRTYHRERKKSARKAVEGSRQVSSMLSNQGWAADMARKVSFNYLPDWLLKLMGDTVNQHRPQALFLERVPDRGTRKAKPERISARAFEYRRIRQQRLLVAVAQQQQQQQLARQASLLSLAETAETLAGNNEAKTKAAVEPTETKDEPVAV